MDIVIVVVVLVLLEVFLIVLDKFLVNVLKEKVKFVICVNKIDLDDGKIFEMIK